MNLRNPREYIERNLRISNKSKQLVPLTLKPAQARLYDIIREEHDGGRPPRILILKARQLGLSTLTEGLMFQDTVTRQLVQTLIVAHREDATANLFRMNKLFYELLPPPLQPMRKNSNAAELVFENPTKRAAEKQHNPGLRSRIRCVTAGGGGIGRSDTLTNVHLSEFAFWPGNKNDTLDGILQAVPNDPNTLVVIESTPNGYNEFKTLWDDAVAGKNGFRAVFLPWYLEPEYRLPVKPGTVFSEEELALGEALGLSGEQLSWRRWCIRHNCRGDVDKFHQEYPGTADEAFLFSGRPFFDNQTIALQKCRAPTPCRVGSFSGEPETPGGVPADWAFREDGSGILQIFDEPEPGAPYVIGGDTAGEGSDSFTAFVIDNRTGKQVAELSMLLSEILYARQLYCLGLYYNTALIAVEVNFSTYPEMKLEEWGYPNLYQRERFDTFTGAMTKSCGFRTTAQTRPVMLATLHTVMEETPELVVSAATLTEMLHFVYSEKQRPQAEEGAHDDLVMAAAICHVCRTQQRYLSAPTAAAGTKWRADQWEDYRAADAAGKQYLISIWGQPR